jgi:predicted O-methyltransferase YrrM
MENFNYYCNLHGSDKGDAFNNSNQYANYYESWFFPIKYTATNICEIGVYNGSSLKAYKDYFPNAHIIGLDIDDKSEYNTDRITTKILNQAYIESLNEFVLECQSKSILFDFILDDGSHDVSHQQLSFGVLFPLIKPGGFYIIEDLCASHFVLGESLYGYRTSINKKRNNTHKFLIERPFYSPWISEDNLTYIENNVNYVSTFDRLNHQWQATFRCNNGYPARSITSIIKKL